MSKNPTNVLIQVEESSVLSVCCKMYFILQALKRAEKSASSQMEN